MGYAENERALLEADHDITPEQFDAVVADEMRTQATSYIQPHTDFRSPEEMLEDLIPAKRRVQFFDKPLYDLRTVLEEQDGGIFSEEHAIPEMFRVRSSPVSVIQIGITVRQVILLPKLC